MALGGHFCARRGDGKAAVGSRRRLREPVTEKVADGIDYGQTAGDRTEGGCEDSGLEPGCELMKHRQVIELCWFGRARMLLDLQETATCCDRFDTDREGKAKEDGKARRGRTKERRSDCTLDQALVLDGIGFVRHPQTFVGNTPPTRHTGLAAGRTGDTGGSARVGAEGVPVWLP